MKPSKTLTFCMLSLAHLLPSFSQGANNDSGTNLACLSSRASIRHKEPNGIGYNQGYSTVEVFGAPRYLKNANILPFIDARLHIFNNKEPAINAGLGARYLSGKFIWGINSYYDYRKTHRWHYNQYSLGLEMLSKFVDLRLGGYLPLGRKESKYYGSKFSHFQEHYAIISRKKEFAMKGANAEIGFHIRDLEKISVYGALGPYYFTNHGKDAFGGEGRINVTFLNHIKLELSGSYDQVFKWIGQGEAGLNISFGPKIKRKKKKSFSLSSCDILTTRLMQPVDRQEIIVLDKYKIRSRATNPSTNTPYYFIFVNNQSHSLGTYDSPYATITDAEGASLPGDILYVFPGNGSAYEMGATGLSLKENQKLFGSGTNQTLFTTAGNILIPNQTKLLPTIIATGNSSSGIVNLANNNEVSGMNIIGNSSFTGIQGGDPAWQNPLLNVQNVNIHNNVILGGFTKSAIRITATDNILINENTCNVQMLATNDINLIQAYCISDTATMQISNNFVQGSISGLPAGIPGIIVHSHNTASAVANVYNNQVHLKNSPSDAVRISYGIVAYAQNAGSSLTATVAQNIINVEFTNGGFSQGILAGAGNASSYLDLLIENNQVLAVSNATGSNSGKAKAIGVDNNSETGSHVKIIGNTVYAYGSGNIPNWPPGGQPDSISGIQVKNNFSQQNSIFTADIISNKITVIGKSSLITAPIYGIYSQTVNNPNMGNLIGEIALNQGNVQGPTAVNITAAPKINVVNNDLEIKK